MKETIRIGRHRAGAKGDSLAQTAGRIEHRKLKKCVAVDILVSGGVRLNLRARGFDGDRSGFRGNGQQDGKADRHGISNVQISIRRGKARRVDCQAVIVLWHVIESEGA